MIEKMGKPTWMVSRSAPGKIKMEGTWGGYWMLVTGDVNHLRWESGRGERRLAQGSEDTVILPLEAAQTKAEDAVRAFFAFDNYDPNERWHK